LDIIYKDFINKWIYGRELLNRDFGVPTLLRASLKNAILKIVSDMAVSLANLLSAVHGTRTTTCTTVCRRNTADLPRRKARSHQKAGILRLYRAASWFEAKVFMWRPRTIRVVTYGSTRAALIRQTMPNCLRPSIRCFVGIKSPWYASFTWPMFTPTLDGRR
jgi:hypothetical protein